MRARELHRGSGVVVYDVCCDGGPRQAGTEEESPTTQIVLVRRGLFVRSVGRHAVVAEPTRALFFGRDEGYRTAHPVAGGDRCTAISIDLSGPLPPSVPTTAEDDLAHRRLVTSLARRDLSALEADGAVLDLCARILAHSGRVPTGGPDARSRTCDAAREWIVAHFAELLRLDEIARTLACSPFHLCRAFRRAHGVTMGRFQTRLRVRAALDRISDGESDLTRLALDLGFYDHSHLCRAFRRELGFPPSVWRARNSVQARDGAFR